MIQIENNILNYSEDDGEHEGLSQRSAGIAASAKNGNYKGREKIKIDKLVAQEIFLDYEAKKINSADASEKLGISKSTFLRRYREYKKANQ